MNTQARQTLEDYFSKFPIKRYKEGELLLSPGSKVKDVHFLVSGHVREYLVSPQGVELTVHIYEMGSAFPLIPVVHEFENDHYFDSITDCEILVAPGKDFIAFLHAHPDVMFDTLSRLLLGLRGMVNRIEYLTLNKARARLAASLLYLGRHFGQAENGKIVLTQRFTHHEIASVVGLARETVSLELEQMVSLGLVSFNGRNIVIEKPQALEEMIEV